MYETVLRVLSFHEVWFVVCGGLLSIATVGYHFESSFARRSAMAGFGVLALLLSTVVVSFLSEGTLDVWRVGGIIGIAVSVHAFAVVSRDWSRADQLTTIITLVVVFLSPFYLLSGLDLWFMEALAAHLHLVFQTLGYDVRLMPLASTGNVTQLTFDNGGFFYINWGCTGIDFVVLYVAIVLSAKTAWSRKLVGVALTILTVYLVNMIRLLFVGMALAGDWFGPLVGAENTLQMTFFIAEEVLAQIFILIVAVLYFFFLLWFLPDLRTFVTEYRQTLF